jgi:hypothetical protein
MLARHQVKEGPGVLPRGTPVPVLSTCSSSLLTESDRQELTPPLVSGWLRRSV